MEAARERLELLRLEISQLEAFIEMGERIANSEPGPIASGVLVPLAPRRRTRSTTATRTIVEALTSIIKGHALPVGRDRIMEMLSEQNIEIVGHNPDKNLATILWRNRNLFEHVPGEGYLWIGPM